MKILILMKLYTRKGLKKKSYKADLKKIIFEKFYNNKFYINMVK